MTRLVQLVLLALVAVSCGCSLTRSRYAMDDPVYAAKYADGAERGDLLGKAKQALDARHTEGLGGLYLSGGAQHRPDSDLAMLGGELGLEGYLTNWSTARIALSGYLGEVGAYGGLELGARLQTPTRIAPFVGLGFFQGFSESTESAEYDGVDNDDDIFIDEAGEEKEVIDGWLSAVYPELGVHCWLNGSCRLTGYSRYFITSEGRAHDDWLLGVQFAYFAR